LRRWRACPHRLRADARGGLPLELQLLSAG
jgi:hypothetical protein